MKSNFEYQEAIFEETVRRDTAGPLETWRSFYPDIDPRQFCRSDTSNDKCPSDYSGVVKYVGSIYLSINPSVTNFEGLLNFYVSRLGCGRDIQAYEVMEIAENAAVCPVLLKRVADKVLFEDIYINEHPACNTITLTIDVFMDLIERRLWRFVNRSSSGGKVAWSFEDYLESLDKTRYLSVGRGRCRTVFQGTAISENSDFRERLSEDPRIKRGCLVDTEENPQVGMRERVETFDNFKRVWSKYVQSRT